MNKLQKLFLYSTTLMVAANGCKPDQAIKANKAELTIFNDNTGQLIRGRDTSKIINFEVNKDAPSLQSSVISLQSDSQKTFVTDIKGSYVDKNGDKVNVDIKFVDSKNPRP